MSEQPPEVVPTTVTARMRRPRSFAMFADITDAPIRFEDVPPLVRVTFEADLTEQQIADVRARMESVDDDDQAARAGLAEHLSVLDGEPDCEQVGAATAALIRYTLG